ncbi:MAG TPA: S1 RNA-binding domain-containing protein [Polyangiaceae bacterium LLY-WYZ-15_(1-7)]|nr:hypothetical protein [Myxococcales bacterium]HJL00705.1 S1 RNA-binding domain-containing protein [Polyangiaceae bacterium LLY-WYZ-15_(1-7)]HJL07772.1 S1 RNA-binding domain-containing protein [Polyangiaceae bacterium LLY-WYZ-15_(1-7)]HJL28389.1 S1 RNA-binding domain-containing protein [Polyangiaceae bacterium LLY-WYZ-15_(1-7)]HJL45065.1 S1 RNA-binding domain-containing protein [Polyangiaceae bacterium LLY-WYZ-15_(1-7)]
MSDEKKKGVVVRRRKAEPAKEAEPTPTEASTDATATPAEPTPAAPASAPPSAPATGTPATGTPTPGAPPASAPAASAPAGAPTQAEPAAAPAPTEPARSDVSAPAGGASFAELFEESDAAVPSGRKLSVGDEITGTVAHVGDTGAFVDLGARQQALYPRAELLDVHGELSVKVGDTLRGFVVRIGPDGTPELGKRLGRGMSVDELRAAMEEKLPVEGKISGVNKGGVSVDLGGLRAFCPMGQLDTRFVNDPSVFLNQTHRFHVVEIRGERDVVVSRRSVLEAEAGELRAQILERVTPGARLAGRVVRVRDFGAFVDLGGIDGLIPARELTYDRRRPEQVVKEGDSVEVIVLEVTERRHKKTGEPETRITLSLKALEADPFDRVDELAPAGAVIEGTVRKLMDFGAFIEIAPGLEGLLHVSELGAGAHHPSSYLSVGQPLLVTVQSVDPERKRVSLAPAPKGAQAGTRISQAGPRKGEIVKCTVDRVERYGVFVQVEGVPGRAGRGLIPERETGTAQGTDLKRAFPQGKELQAKVLETGKLKLSIKAVKEDEDRKVFEDYKKKQGGAGMGTLGDLLSGLKK